MKNNKKFRKVYLFKKLEGKVSFAKEMIITLTKSVKNKIGSRGTRVSTEVLDKNPETDLVHSENVTPSYVFLVPNPDVRGGNGWINSTDINELA